MCFASVGCTVACCTLWCHTWCGTGLCGEVCGVVPQAISKPCRLSNGTRGLDPRTYANRQLLGCWPLGAQRAVGVPPPPFCNPPLRDLLERGWVPPSPPPLLEHTQPPGKQKIYCRMNNSAHGNVMLSAVNNGNSSLHVNSNQCTTTTTKRDVHHLMMNDGDQSELDSLELEPLLVVELELEPDDDYELESLP